MEGEQPRCELNSENKARNVLLADRNEKIQKDNLVNLKTWR